MLLELSVPSLNTILLTVLLLPVMYLVCNNHIVQIYLSFVVVFCILVKYSFFNFMSLYFT